MTLTARPTRTASPNENGASSSSAPGAAAAPSDGQKRYSISYYKELHNDEEIPVVTDTEIQQDPFRRMFTDGHDTIQVLAVFVGCYLTYTIQTCIACIDVALAQAIVICWGCATYPHLSASIAAGSFAGMTGLLHGAPGGDENAIYYQYGWLFLLATVSATLWIFVGSKYKLLVGYGGRLGTFVLPAQILVQISMILISYGVPTMSSLSWSSFGSAATLWNNSVLMDDGNTISGTRLPDNWAYILLLWGGIMFNTTISGYVFTTAGMPLNPIQTPTNISLFVMLVYSSVTYFQSDETEELVLGTGVSIGSFVAMGSLPTIWDYIFAGFMTGFWALLWVPFCQHFAGKMGFIAFCGFSSYVLLKYLFWSVLSRCGMTTTTITTPTTTSSSTSKDPPMKQTSATTLELDVPSSSFLPRPPSSSRLLEDEDLL